jgi:hypothetical protein
MLLEQKKTRCSFRPHLALILLMVVIGLPSTARADVVTDWNQIALNMASAINPQFAQQTRALAIVHVAMFDAVNSIDQRFSTYAIRLHAPSGASPEAAAATAAYRVLLTLAPTQQVSLDTAYAASLAQIPDGVSKTDGITVGEAVAAAILALRSGDGSSITLPYTQPPGPGVWQPTPPAFLPANNVAWGNVLPFTMRSFLAEPPPALTSEDYTEDFNEVKRLGSINSTERTADQTEAANFWVEASTITWNRIARLAADAHGNSLSDNARLFALLNMAAADGIITGFNTKYTYNFWRPVTAIRAADTDGNPDTVADPTWLPLVVTPRFPDYTSNHTIYSAAAAKVLASFFHRDHFDFSIASSTAPGAVRSYHSFSQAAKECGLARIWVGFHFRTAVRFGLKQGKQVGGFAFKHYLKPVKRHDRDDDEDEDEDEDKD